MRSGREAAGFSVSSRGRDSPSSEFGLAQSESGRSSPAPGDVRAVLPELLRPVERGVRALEQARRRVAVEELGDAAGEPETLLVRPESGSAHRVVHAAEELLAVRPPTTPA